ncbi:MAG TPA: tannase/feruloyl esterase family alpha/beta hydrolase [Myxococcota bacterium]|nr:tannase/feruloyl esterase family alpha/beta hydrolase [Myxococcota bacterium]
MSQRSIRLAAAVGPFVASLSLMTGGDVSAAPAAADAAAACSALSEMTVPAGEIKLPTSGAHVQSATLQPASGSGAAAKPEYCEVLAQISPVDPHAQPITVRLNLPTQWNGMAVQMGGGGMDGFLITADGPGPGAATQAAPLALGYATFGSDGGHSVPNPFDADAQAAAFMNDEVLANYAGDQLKKTHDLALALIRACYGHAPRRMYFVGASEGGREALVVAQRWGADCDGAISYYPAAGDVPLLVAFGRDSRALAAPGAYPGPAKQALLHNAVVAACDAGDGARDGIISNPADCKFDVAQLRCPSGRDNGDTCLSDAQIAALKVMATDLHLSFPLASGETGIPGHHVFSGVDLTARISGLGASAPTPPPLAPTEPLHYIFFNVFARGVVTRDPIINPLALDLENPGAWRSRLSELSSLLDAAEPDLSTFDRHGGKLILVHGLDDSLIPVGRTENYYKSVVQKLGAANVDGFARFYTVPGYGHGGGAFIVDWDSLAALDHWVETGVAPSDPVAADDTTRGRTRPLCRYPAWPKYNGAGDINAATSFSCVSP